MAKDDKKQDTQKPVKPKTKFGLSLSMLSFGKKKSSGPTPEELDKQANEQLSVDRKAVTELKNRLTGLGAVVPPVIESALAAADPRLPPKAVLQEGRKRVDAALQSKDAVASYLAARVELIKAKDQGGLLKFGSHPLVSKFTTGLDQIQSTADRRWSGATTATEAAQHAEFLTVQLAGAVRLRGEVHDALDRADKDIAAAESAIEKVSGIGSIDVSGVRKKVADARQALTQLTQSSDIAKAMKLMEGWRDELALQTKGQSKSIDKLTEYKQLRQSVLDQIGKASVLRGATEDTPMRTLLEMARTDIGRADQTMSQSSDPKVFASAKEILAQHKDLLDRAKRIDAELKKQAQTDLEALPKYTDAWQALVRAREQIAGLPGATKQLNEADSLLARARLGQNGQPPGGYAAALVLLKGKADALLKQANEVSKNLATDRDKKFPGLPKAREAAQAAMLRYINAHPPEQAAAQREALAKALTQDDPESALSDLAIRWDKAVESQRDLDKKLFSERERMTGLLEKLKEAKAPEEVLKGLRNTEAVDRFRQLNDYGRAMALAQRATQAADDYLKLATKINSQWEEAEASLKKAAEKALRWAAWPPLKVLANGVVSDIRFLIDAMANGGDRQKALETAKRILERVDTLESRAKAQNLDPKVDLSSYDQAIEQARAAWKKTAEIVRKALDALADALTKGGAGGSAKTTTWHQQFAALEQRWEQTLARPVLSDGQSPADALTKSLQQFTAEAKIIAKSAAAAPSDTEALNGLLGDAKKEDQQTALRELHARLVPKVVGLESAGAKVKAFWELLGREFDPTVAARFGDKWKQLDPVLDKTLQGKREELLSLRTESIQKADALDKKLNSLLSYDQVRFEGFFDDLRGRATDARAMLMTDDPTLMAAGQRQIDELSKTLTQARKGEGGKEGEGSKTFDDVAELWATLSKKVGQKELMSRLPATYNRLYGELKTATAKAKSMPPAQGWPLLEALRVPIEDAVAKAGVMAERYAIFKERQTQLEERLVELHKLTATRFTEKTEAYNARFATRMASAKQMAKQEGQMDAAFGLLDALDKELADLMASPQTARTKLQKLDGEAAAEQRELRDMAREWERQREYWSDTLLPQVSKAMAARGEEKMTEYEDLKAAVSHAAAPLKGYLAVISSLPHEYLPANPSPDMPQARAAFSSAQKRLMQLQKVANRLLQGGGSTNVDLETDLQKLEEEWSQRVERLKTAFGKLAESIQALPEQAGTDPADESTYLDGKALTQLKTAAHVLSGSIPEAAARFPGRAFSVPLAVLRSPSSSPAERKKAREDALRTMRELRSSLVEGSLFRLLFDGTAAGLLGVDVRAELGLLRASLKKIELAVLVAV